VSQLDGTGLKRLHRDWRRRTEGRLALVLDGLGTPVNVGSIVRTAAAYSLDHLWLAGPTPPPTSPGAAKTALGTDRYLTWTQCANGAEGVELARQDGYLTIAVELTGQARPLHELVTAADVCLVVGHEDHGISKAALAACDDTAYLPQLGRVGSLNVATAAAIAIYEVRSWRWRGGLPPT
jgi:tRNA (guanosine-2'-O-)-methyltransferase